MEQAVSIDAGATSSVSNNTTYKPNSTSEEALAHQYRDRLVGMLTKMTRDPERAEDLAQDTLIVVINSLRQGKIRNTAKLSSYIYSTAKFLYFGWLRKLDNQVELRDDLEIEASTTSIENVLIEEERKTAIALSISELSTERDRDILTRAYIRQQSKQEICEALLLSADHFDRVISRARKRLRETTSLRQDR